MLHRFLIVGLGGSGGKTARFLHRELRYRLDSLGWTEGMPAGWQFLQIDVPTMPDENSAALPEQLPQVGGHYASLSRRNRYYEQVDAGLIPPDADRPLLESYLGWRPVPREVRVPVADGAGQFRALGRMLALGSADSINVALSEMIDRLNVPTAIGQLDRLSQALGNAPSDEPDPVVLIISSAGGGSGAGMVNDVADILRATGHSWCDRSVGFLFTGDVFDDLPEPMRRGIQPNSLATISEMMAGYWNHDAAGVEFAPYGEKDIDVGAVGRRGVRHPFLIGASNGVVWFGQQNDVYASLGRSLAALMTSAAAQSKFVDYGLLQWEHAARGLADFTRLRPPGGENSFNSIGSASVSLGRDRFARYAAQRLARSSVEHLLRAHHVGKKVPDEVHPDDASAEAVTANWNWFVTGCGLDELGEHHNQVIDALRPSDRDGRIEALHQAARARLGRFPDATPPQWAERIARLVAAAEPAFVGADDGALQATGVTWVEKVQRDIEATTLQAIGRFGVVVTVAFFERLRRHVSDVVVEVEDEARRFSLQAGMRDEGIRGPLGPLGTKRNVGPENAAVGEALRRAVKTLEFDSEARLCRLAGTLLRDLAENQVAPLETELARALSGLNEEKHPPVGESVLDQWPGDDAVPPGLAPAVSEVLLESVSTYPETYKRLVQATARSASLAESVQIAIGQVATGTTVTDGEDAEVVGDARIEDLELGEVLTVVAGWWPAEFDRLRAASRARYGLKLKSRDLLARAEEWVGRRDSAIGAYVYESLREYLIEHDDRGRPTPRRDRFMEAFTAALSLARPLAGVSDGMLQIVHGTPQTRLAYSFTEIPLDHTDMRDPLIETMRTLNVFGGDQSQEDLVTRSVLGTSHEVQSIEIITWFQAPYNPVVFRSLMSPISAAWWAQRQTTAGQQRFWRWRRARRLTEFVPLGPASRRAMVAGWFLGRLLGEVTGTEADPAVVEVCFPELRTTVGFPDPLLGPAPRCEGDLLAAVLESLPLAMVEANSQGRLNPFFPYQRLLDLGAEADTTRILRAWVLQGATPGGTTPIERAYSPKDRPVTLAESTPADRKEATLAYLNNRVDVYVTKVADTVVDQLGFFDLPRHYELKDDYAVALPRLARIVSGIHIEDQGGDGD